MAAKDLFGKKAVDFELSAALTADSSGLERLDEFSASFTAGSPTRSYSSPLAAAGRSLSGAATDVGGKGAPLLPSTWQGHQALYAMHAHARIAARAPMATNPFALTAETGRHYLSVEPGATALAATGRALLEALDEGDISKGRPSAGRAARAVEAALARASDAQPAVGPGAGTMLFASASTISEVPLLPPVPLAQAHEEATRAIGLREEHVARLARACAAFARARRGASLAHNMPKQWREMALQMRSLREKIGALIALVRRDSGEAWASIIRWQEAVASAHPHGDHGGPPGVHPRAAVHHCFAYGPWPDYQARMSTDVVDVIMTNRIPLYSWANIDPRNNPLLAPHVVAPAPPPVVHLTREEVMAATHDASAAAQREAAALHAQLELEWDAEFAAEAGPSSVSGPETDPINSPAGLAAPTLTFAGGAAATAAAAPGAAEGSPLESAPGRTSTTEERRTGAGKAKSSKSRRTGAPAASAMSAALHAALSPLRQAVGDEPHDALLPMHRSPQSPGWSRPGSSGVIAASASAAGVARGRSSTLGSPSAARGSADASTAAAAAGSSYARLQVGRPWTAGALRRLGIHSGESADIDALPHPDATSQSQMQHIAATRIQAIVRGRAVRAGRARALHSAGSAHFGGASGASSRVGSSYSRVRPTARQVFRSFLARTDGSSATAGDLHEIYSRPATGGSYHRLHAQPRGQLSLDVRPLVALRSRSSGGLSTGGRSAGARSTLSGSSYSRPMTPSAAASRIQAGLRGMRDRRVVRLLAAHTHAAAELIQAGARGFLARRLASQLRIRADAAAAIRAAVLASLARKRAAAVASSIRHWRGTVGVQRLWRGYAARMHTTARATLSGIRLRHALGGGVATAGAAAGAAAGAPAANPLVQLAQLSAAAARPERLLALAGVLRRALESERAAVTDTARRVGAFPDAMAPTLDPLHMLLVRPLTLLLRAAVALLAPPVSLAEARALCAAEPTALAAVIESGGGSWAAQRLADVATRAQEGPPGRRCLLLPPPALAVLSLSLADVCLGRCPLLDASHLLASAASAAGPATASGPGRTLSPRIQKPKIWSTADVRSMPLQPLAMRGEAAAAAHPGHDGMHAAGGSTGVSTTTASRMGGLTGGSSDSQWWNVSAGIAHAHRMLTRLPAQAQAGLRSPDSTASSSLGAASALPSARLGDALFALPDVRAAVSLLAFTGAALQAAELSQTAWRSFIGRRIGAEPLEAAASARVVTWRGKDAAAGTLLPHTDPSVTAHHAAGIPPTAILLPPSLPIHAASSAASALLCMPACSYRVALLPTLRSPRFYQAAALQAEAAALAASNRAQAFALQIGAGAGALADPSRPVLRSVGLAGESIVSDGGWAASSSPGGRTQTQTQRFDAGFTGSPSLASDTYAGGHHRTEFSPPKGLDAESSVLSLQSPSRLLPQHDRGFEAAVVSGTGPAPLVATIGEFPDAAYADPDPTHPSIGVPVEAQVRAAELERRGAGAIVRQQALLLQHAMALGLLPVARMTHPAQAAAVLAAAASAARVCLASCGPAARTESATLICITSAGGSDAAAGRSDAATSAAASAASSAGVAGPSEPGLDVGALSEQRRMVEATVAVLWGKAAPYTRDPPALRTVRLLQAVLPAGFLPPPPMPLPDVLADGEYAVRVDLAEQEDDSELGYGAASPRSAVGSPSSYDRHTRSSVGGLRLMDGTAGRDHHDGAASPHVAGLSGRLTLARAESFSAGGTMNSHGDDLRVHEPEHGHDYGAAPSSRRSSVVGVPDEHAYALGELGSASGAGGTLPLLGEPAIAGAPAAEGGVGHAGQHAHMQAPLSPGAHAVTTSMLRAAADAHEEPAAAAARQLQQTRVLADAAAGAFVDAEQDDTGPAAGSLSPRERGGSISVSVSAEDGGGRGPPGSASSRSNSALPMPRRARAIASSSAARREQRSQPLGSFADATPMTVRGRMRSRVLAAQASVGSLTEAAALIAVVLCGHGTSSTSSGASSTSALHSATSQAAAGPHSSPHSSLPHPLALSLPPAPGSPLAPWTTCSVAVVLVVVPPPPPPVAGGRLVAAARLGVLATRLPFAAPARIASHNRISSVAGGTSMLVMHLPRREAAQEALAQLLRRCPQGARSPLTSLPAPPTRTAAGGLGALEELLGGLGGIGGLSSVGGTGGSAAGVAMGRAGASHAPGTSTAAAGGRSFASYGSATHLPHDTLGRASQRALTSPLSSWAATSLPDGASAHAVPAGAGASSELLAEGDSWQEPLPDLIALPLPRLLQVMVETRLQRLGGDSRADAATAASASASAPASASARSPLAAASQPHLLVRLVLLQETGRWVAAAAPFSASD